MTPFDEAFHAMHSVRPRIEHSAYQMASSVVFDLGKRLPVLPTKRHFVRKRCERQQSYPLPAARSTVKHIREKYLRHFAAILSPNLSTMSTCPKHLHELLATDHSLNATAKFEKINEISNQMKLMPEHVANLQCKE